MSHVSCYLFMLLAMEQWILQNYDSAMDQDLDQDQDQIPVEGHTQIPLSPLIWKNITSLGVAT